MLKLCVAGAAGRMGNAIINEAISRGHQITGAIEAPNSPSIGTTLRATRHRQFRHNHS